MNQKFIKQLYSHIFAPLLVYGTIQLKSIYVHIYLLPNTPLHLHVPYNYASSWILFHFQQDRCMENGLLDNVHEHYLDWYIRSNLTHSFYLHTQAHCSSNYLHLGWDSSLKEYFWWYYWWTVKFVNYQISRIIIKQNISELYNYKRTWYGCCSWGSCCNGCWFCCGIYCRMVKKVMFVCIGSYLPFYKIISQVV